MKQKLLVIGFEHGWLKYFENCLVLPGLEEVQWKLDMHGKLSIYKNRKMFEPDIVLLRRLPKSDLDKRFFEALQDFNGLVLNKPSASLKSFQIYHTLKLLKEKGYNVPETTCFYGHEIIDTDKFPVILKIEGEHAGYGKALIKDKEQLKEALNLLVSNRRKYLLQEYVEPVRDFRVLVVGGKVIGVVSRKSDNWKKNVSSEPELLQFSIPELEKIAVDIALLIETEIAGVDVLETESGYYVLEVNAEPGIEYFGEKAYKSIKEYIEQQCQKRLSSR
ncbi:hypothetical protein KY337_04445 [Candidatus Woesearchaeota archaeon]|nr:hypothetical protein [Candidatus Woesearchaeota archaeon]